MVFAVPIFRDGFVLKTQALELQKPSMCIVDLHQYLRFLGLKSCRQVKVDIGLLFKSHNFLQKRLSVIVSILKKWLKTENSKKCYSDAYSQSSSCRLLGRQKYWKYQGYRGFSFYLTIVKEYICQQVVALVGRWSKKANLVNLVCE